MAAVFTCDIWNKYNNKTLYSKSGTCPNLSKHMHQILFKLVMPTNLARLTKIETEDISCILFFNFSFCEFTALFQFTFYLFYCISYPKNTFFLFFSWNQCSLFFKNLGHLVCISDFFFYVNRHFISMYPTLRNCYVAVIIIVFIINLYFFKFLVMLLR